MDLVREECDPLTAAVCSLPRIEAMADELFAENAAGVEGWALMPRLLRAAAG
jgi:hypothetical protein